ncbi:MAG: 3-oxoacyl-ACP reductase FabG [Acidimicrobiia bacterium]|jgi:3-oxoacyl-[acyl-carrier protein] reductase
MNNHTTTVADDHSLAGQVVLVTGGSRGIGAATARAAAQAGAAVAIGFRQDADAAFSVVESIRETGKVADAFRADVSDPAEAKQLITSVEASFGKIDGLVNNAGIMPSSPLVEMSDEEWDAVLRTDLFGPFYCSRAALPGMVQRGSGSIVMISSRLGQIGWPELAHYSAAKAGLLGLTKSMAREYGPQGVRVNAVAPGFTITDMTRDIVDTESGRRRLAELPSRRFPEPENVAAAVVFLLTDAAALFHGQTLNPNGGGFMQ